jgi:hypothetical protein
MKNAIIAAVVSALVSASGTLAASQYVITSTKQIKPSVLRTLEKASRTLGAVPAAAPGATGPQGSTGERGAKGRPRRPGCAGLPC